MILADTSVWMNHFSKDDTLLSELLRQGQVLVHPFIIGEVALGNLWTRDRRLAQVAVKQALAFARR